MNIRSVTHFSENEYKQWAQNKNFSSLANIFGFKPTANKVNYTVLTRNINDFKKVDYISNTTASETEYLGGAGNIDGVIINIARSYNCSNNICLYETDGDFGARLNNEPSASRYIKAKKGKMFEMIFDKIDFNVLPRYNLEGKDIEYQYLTFNLPMLIVNGSSGTGSGHAQLILPRDPKEILRYLKGYLKGKKIPYKGKPYYNGFKGTIEQGDELNKWLIKGVIKKLSIYRLEITELPVGENYKSYIKKLDKLQDNGTIKDYDDLCDPKKDVFHFIIKCDKTFSSLPDQTIMEKLKLISKPAENYTAFDESNKVHIYKDINEIMQQYIKVRLYFMKKRKEYLIDHITQELKILMSKYLFIKEINSGNLVVTKRKIVDIENDISKIKGIIKIEDSYNYLLRIPIQTLTKEKMEQLLQELKNKKAELEEVKIKSPEDMWLDDLAKIKLP